MATEVKWNRSHNQMNFVDRGLHIEMDLKPLTWIEGTPQSKCTTAGMSKTHQQQVNMKKSDKTERILLQPLWRKDITLIKQPDHRFVHLEYFVTLVSLRAQTINIHSGYTSSSFPVQHTSVAV